MLNRVCSVLVTLTVLSMLVITVGAVGCGSGGGGTTRTTGGATAFAGTTGTAGGAINSAGGVASPTGGTTDAVGDAGGGGMASTTTSIPNYAGTVGTTGETTGGGSTSTMGASGGGATMVTSGGTTSDAGVTGTTGGSTITIEGTGGRGSASVVGGTTSDAGVTSITGGAQASQDGGAPAPCGCNGKSDCAVWKSVFITWYGFNDNSCTVETEHDCNTIAFPGLGPQKHQVATEGKGTYDDPITCAASATDSGGDSESSGGVTLSPGTLVYNPEVKKYFIMEDQCAECTADYLCEPDDDTTPDTDAPTGCKQNGYPHIDFWMGPSFMQNATTLNNCEDNSTIGNPYAGTGTVVVNPPDNLEVVTTPLYTGTGAGGGCWTSVQVNSDSCP
jgi:hypothetical protein